MARCGMPTLPLKAENVYAVLMEAFSERASADPDLDRSKANLNEYYGPSSSGRELAEMFCKQAEEYRLTDKNGHQKKLRKDADICFAGIIKPDMEYINSLSKVEQKRFFVDALEVLKGILSSKGLTLVGCAIHYDELAPHVHYVAYDKEYKVAQKVGLPLFNQLNNTFPKLMREKGWELENLGKYNPEVTKTMTPEQKAAYKEERIAEKKAAKKHGQTSKQFKALKDIERAEKAVEFAKRREAEAERKVSEVSGELRRRTEAVEVREQKITVREEDISRQLTELRKEGVALDSRSATLDDQEESLLRRKRNFNEEVRAEAKRQVKELIPELSQKVTNNILQSPDFNIGFLRQVVWVAIEKFATIVEKAFGIRLMDRAYSWLEKNYIPFTQDVVQTIVEANLEHEADEIDEDPGIGMW